MKPLKEAGVVDESGSLRGLYGQMGATKQVYDEVLKRVESETNVTSGSILCYDREQAAEYHGMASGWGAKLVLGKLMRYPITHLAVVLNNKETGVQEQSHMWGGPKSVHTIAKRTLGNHLFQAFIADPKKIFSEENQLKLKEAYGDQWEQKVLAMYDKHCQKIHRESPDFSTLSNPKIRRAIAWLGIRWSPVHVDWRDIDFSPLRHTICSEFVMITTFKSLAALEKEVKADLIRHKTGVEPSSEEVKSADNLIDLPVRKHRRLHRVTPTDVLERGKKILKPVEFSPTLNAMVNCPGHTL